MDDEQKGPIIRSLEQTDDERPEWICVDCRTANPADAQQCVTCGYVLSAHTPTPGSGPLTERPPIPTDSSVQLPPPAPLLPPPLLPGPTTDGPTDGNGLASQDRDDAALAPVIEESGHPLDEEAPASPVGDPATAPPDESVELLPDESVELPPIPPSPAGTPLAGAFVTPTAPPAAPAPDADLAERPKPTAPTLLVPAAPMGPPPAIAGAQTPALPAVRRVDARPRPAGAVGTPLSRPPGRLARTAPETLLLAGTLVSVVAWSLIALDEMAGEAGLLGLVGLGLGAVGIYVLGVGLIQAVLRRGGRRF